MIAMMYKTGADEKALLELLMDHIRTWIDVATYDYEAVLRKVNIRDVITQAAQETKLAGKGNVKSEKNQGNENAVADDKLPTKDVQYVLQAMLSLEHQGCAACFSTLHACSQCPKAWTTVVNMLLASNKLTEAELEKVRAVGAICCAQTFPGVDNYKHVEDW